jgi:multiple sugar transport system substrate-binding protein
MGQKRLSRREVLKWMGMGLAGSAVLGACAAPAVAPSVAEPAASEGEAPAPAAPAKTEVTMWHGWTGADNTEMLTRMIDGYNETNTDGITVVPVAYGWDDFFAKWILASASGSPPDVALYHPTEVPEFVERDTVMPLDELAEQVDWSWEGIAEPVKQQCYYQGKLYGFIEDIHPLAMYYNVDLVEQADWTRIRRRPTGKSI